MAEVGFVGYHRDLWLRNERERGWGGKKKKEERRNKKLVKSCFDVTITAKNCLRLERKLTVDESLSYCVESWDGGGIEFLSIELILDQLVNRLCIVSNFVGGT